MAIQIKTRSRLRYWHAIAMLLSLIGIMFAASIWPPTLGTRIFFQDVTFVLQRRRPSAHYDGYYFIGHPKMSEFVAHISDGTPSVFVELPDGSRHLLSALPEEMASILMKYNNRLHDVENTILYTDNLSKLRYTNGRLRDADIYATSQLFRFSPTLEGPYIDLPCDRRTLVKVFGKPKRWGKARILGV